jgi:hypothetical protein
MDSNVRIIRPGERGGDSLRWVEQVSKYLDSNFLIPGTNIRFGLDPILSFFPVVGDLFTFLISGVLIYTMHQHGASRKVVIKMLLNSTLDAVIVLFLSSGLYSMYSIVPMTETSGCSKNITMKVNIKGQGMEYLSLLRWYVSPSWWPHVMESTNFLKQSFKEEG